MGLLIAGHDFVDGICIKAKVNGMEACGRRLLDILPCGEPEFINQHGIAHNSYLTAEEARQIRKYREELVKAICAASHWHHDGK